jgi:hypothetical protein
MKQYQFQAHNILFVKLAYAVQVKDALTAS